GPPTTAAKCSARYSAAASYLSRAWRLASAFSGDSCGSASLPAANKTLSTRDRRQAGLGITGKRPLSKPTTAVQSQRREPLLMAPGAVIRDHTIAAIQVTARATFAYAGANGAKASVNECGKASDRGVFLDG